MGLDVWFPPDVARILSATYEAMCSTVAAGQSGSGSSGAEALDAYRQGFGAALRSVAAGFGLPDPTTEAGLSSYPTVRPDRAGRIVDTLYGEGTSRSQALTVHTGRVWPATG